MDPTESAALLTSIIQEAPQVRMRHICDAMLEMLASECSEICRDMCSVHLACSARVQPASAEHTPADV
jgi:hypothetical protein